jgi:hypothetical protein
MLGLPKTGALPNDVPSLPMKFTVQGHAPHNFADAGAMLLEVILGFGAWIAAFYFIGRYTYHIFSKQAGEAKKKRE